MSGERGKESWRNHQAYGAQSVKMAEYRRSFYLASSLVNENFEEEVTGGKSQEKCKERRGDDDAIRGRMEPQSVQTTCVPLQRAMAGYNNITTTSM